MMHQTPYNNEVFHMSQVLLKIPVLLILYFSRIQQQAKQNAAYLLV